jgi:hypothetical protein
MKSLRKMPHRNAHRENTGDGRYFPTAIITVTNNCTHNN